MRWGLIGLLTLALMPASQGGQGGQARGASTSGALTVYVVDVEGGNATLLIAPSGASLLIDTGNPGARDADRIAAAARDGGLTQIDNVITTHYHSDHVGGVRDLASRLPIRHFFDHGPNVETGPGADGVMQRYAEVYGTAARTIVKPGDTVPVTGLDVRIVTAAGQAIKTPLTGGGQPNPLCAGFKPKDADATENAQSVGTVVTLGQFRMAHMGDLTWNKEFELMCPSNPIGRVDLLMISHHGLDVSNSSVLVHALQPRVAIMNNGIRKGGMPDTMKVVFSSPGLEDLWQLHFSLLGGQEYSAPGMFIANPQPATVPEAAAAPGGGAAAPAIHDGPAFWIKMVAQPNGTFTVSNSRNGFSKTYAGRR
jgi:competence protein ComEC